jgi:hypothetical protein
MMVSHPEDATAMTSHLRHKLNAIERCEISFKNHFKILWLRIIGVGMAFTVSLTDCI